MLQLSISDKTKKVKGVMGKTTIDGLAVRSSSSSNHRASTPVAQRSSTRRSSTNSTRSKSTTSTKQSTTRNSTHKSTPRSTNSAKNALILNSTDISQDIPSTRRARISDFVQLTDNYDDIFGVEEAESSDPEDWSDLLNDLDKAKPVDNGASDFLRNDNVDFFNDLDEEPEPKRPRKKSPRKKKGKRVFKTIGGFLLVLVIVGGAVALIWGDQIISKLTNGNSGLWDTVWSLVSDEIPFETDSNGRTNVLVFGTEGYDMNGSVGNGTHAGSQLTDSIMAVSFDQKTKDIALISLPRDLKVPMACSAGKINEVYSCHYQNGENEAAGAEALAEQVGEVLGIEFQYWAHVNWGSLENIVDLLGGITVTLDEDVNDYYYTTMVVPAGVPTHLSGVQAVALARARHGTTGGDFSRGNTQQKILEGIIQKVVENGIGFTDAINLLNILGDNFRSNFSSENIKSGVALASGFDINNLRQIPLVDYDKGIYYMTTGTINDISYVLPQAGTNNYREIHNYINQMLSSNPAIREGALLAVYNASWTDGAAEAEQAGLESEGFTVLNTGEVSDKDCTDTYCIYKINDGMPATEELLRNKYQLELRSASELPGDIRAGDADFIIVIGNTDGN